jgi:3-deoxy-D-manno-octulosonic acid kinase
MDVRLPDSYVLASHRESTVVAREDALDWARGAVERAGTLYAYAAGQEDARVLQGRGPAYQIEAPIGWCVVRHYRRGGEVARWLGDRYLRAGEPRPLRELRASEEARRRGIETPPVLALAIYPAGAFYRADIVTAYVPGAVDLAAALYGPASLEGEDRLAAWATVGALLRALAERGVVHADLNLKNILLDPSVRPFRTMLLDLDRCRVMDRVAPFARFAMLRRLRRSADRWAALAGRPITADERGAFERAYRGRADG